MNARGYKTSKGFTLMELLAVIVILAVIALIATPKVLNSIEDARKSSFLRSINGIVKTVKLDQGADKFSSPREYFYDKSDLLLLTVNDVKKDELVDMKGEIDGNGFIYVDGDGNIIVDKICDKDYCASGTNNDIEVTPNEGGELTNFDKTDPVISLIGDNVIYVEQNHTYTELGAKARTQVGDPLEYNITEIKLNGEVVGGVDTRVLGAYVITYSATSNDKTVSVERTVYVLDMTPVITMTEPNVKYAKSKEITVNVKPIITNNITSFDYEIKKDGISIEKKTIEGLTGTIKLENTGIYNIIVYVKDNNNHTNQMTRTYKIDTIKPTITVPSSTIVKVTEISTFDLEENIIYSDNTGLTPTLTYVGTLTPTVGNQEIIYTVTDEAGNSETATRTITVVEADGPILNYSSIDSDNIYIGPATIAVTAVDNSNLKSFTYEVFKDGISQGVNNVTVSGKSAEANVSLSETGSYTIKLTGSDEYGTENTSTSGTYLIDNTKPTQSFAINSSTTGSNSWYTALSLKVTGADEHSGVETIKYCSTTETMCDPIISVTGKSVIVTLASETSAQKVCVQTIDKIGNLSDITCSSSYKVDTTAPTQSFAIASQTAGSNSWYKALSLKVTGTDAESGPSTIKYCTTTSSTCTPGTTYSSAVALSTSASAQRICANVTNGAGITSTTTCSGTYLVDSAAPTSNSVKINNGNSLTNSKTVTLTLASSGATEMCISNTTSCSSWKTMATSSSHTLAGTEGTNTVYVWFRDAAGNQTSYVSDSITLDTKGPVYSSGGSVSLGSISAATFTDGATPVSVYYYVSTSSSTPSASSITSTSRSFSYSCGNTYYAFAKAVDSLGNYTIRSLGSVYSGACCSEGTYSYYSCNSSGYKVYRRYNGCTGSYETETRYGEYCESSSSCGSYGDCESSGRQYRTCYYYYGGSRYSYDDWKSCTYVPEDYVECDPWGVCMKYADGNYYQRQYCWIYEGGDLVDSTIEDRPC